MHYLQLCGRASPQENAPPSQQNNQRNSSINVDKFSLSFFWFLRFFTPVVRHLPIQDQPPKVKERQSLPRFERSESHFYRFTTHNISKSNHKKKFSTVFFLQLHDSSLHSRFAFDSEVSVLHTEKPENFEIGKKLRTHHCVADVWVDSWRVSMTCQMKCPMASIDLRSSSLRFSTNCEDFSWFFRPTPRQSPPRTHHFRYVLWIVDMMLVRILLVMLQLTIGTRIHFHAADIWGHWKLYVFNWLLLWIFLHDPTIDDLLLLLMVLHLYVVVNSLGRGRNVGGSRARRGLSQSFPTRRRWHAGWWRCASNLVILLLLLDLLLLLRFRAAPHRLDAAYRLISFGVIAGLAVGFGHGGSVRHFRESFDFQHLSCFEDLRQLLGGHIHFAVVHEVHHGFEVVVLHIFEDDNWMLAWVRCEKRLEFHRLATDRGLIKV